MDPGILGRLQECPAGSSMPLAQRWPVSRLWPFEGVSKALILGAMEGSRGPGLDLFLPELPAALAPHRLGVGVLHFDDVMAVWRRAPL